jgi:carboxylesterase
MLSMTVIITIVSALLGLNLAMLCWALGEWMWARTRKSSWRTSGQLLPSDEKHHRPTIIMVHGFGGSPMDMKPLAQALKDRGFKVVVPVVPCQIARSFAYRRHRYSPDRYLDWLENILTAETDKSGRRPILIGFSMGGTLATIMAARGLSARVVLLAPYFRLALLDGLMASTAAMLRFLLPVVPRLISVGIKDPAGRKIYRPGTKLVCLKSFLHLRVLAARAADQVPRIEVPTLVLTAADDSVADTGGTHCLFQSRPAANVEQCPRSDHVLLFDFDRQWVIRRVVRFLETPGDSL